MNDSKENSTVERAVHPVIFVSAGDPSGDIYGSRLIENLKGLYPNAYFIGLGGPRMKSAGVHLMADQDRIATVGFTEVLREIPYFFGLLKESEDIFRSVRPELVILIDFPGFNLRLARRAKEHGIKTLFYVSPQIWAWRKGRCKHLVRDSDEIAVILPFEVQVFKSWGKDVHYVGHPMIGEIAVREPRDSFIHRYGISPERPVLGLSPGSRRHEIAYHLPVFLRIAEMIREHVPEIQVLVNRAPTISEFEMREKFLDGQRDIILVHDSHHTSIEISSLLLTKSGTSTLEAALLKTPMIVCYRMSRLSHLIAKVLVDVPHISLVNILAGKEIVPEYIQYDFEPEKIFPKAMGLLTDRSEREKMVMDLEGISSQLEGGNPSEKVAVLAASMIENGRSL